MKKDRVLLVFIVYILSIALLGYLSYAINFHPFGFQLELHEDVLEINKGIVNQQNYLIPIEGNFESVVFLIKEINEFINSWLVFIFIISLFASGLLGFFPKRLRANLKIAKYLCLYLVSLAITLVLSIVYFNYHGSIILEKLNSFS